MPRSVKLEDLPPALRKQVQAEMGGQPGRKLSDAETKQQGLPVRCHECGLVSDVYNGKRGWEGHAEESGHHRADLVL